MTLSKDEARRFREWLQKTTSLGERSVTDILSRTRRVMKLIDPLQPRSREELVFRLSEQREFAERDPTVQSQLKRAATLYRRFRKQVSQA